MMLREPTKSVSMTGLFASPFMAVATALRGDIFDNVITDAKIGDTLRCVEAVTGPTYFTAGKDYTVVSYGDSASIHDNEGILVPPNVFERIGLADRFELVRSNTMFVVDDCVSSGEFVEDVKLEELKSWAYRGVMQYRSELRDDVKSYLDSMAKTNSDDGSAVPFESLDDESKGALLVAQFNQKATQTLTNFGLWLDVPTPARFDPDTSYRVRPSNLTFMELAVTQLKADIKDADEKLVEYDTSPEWLW